MKKWLKINQLIFNPLSSSMRVGMSLLLLTLARARTGLAAPESITTSVGMPDNETVVVMKIVLREDGNKSHENNLKEG